MATMRDICTGAAKRIRMIGPSETLEAEDAADLLQAINDMMSSWEGKGIIIDWTGDLGLSATFPLADKHIAGVKAMLAKRVAEDQGKAVTAQLADDARDGWNAISADYRMPDIMRCDTALTNMPSQRKTF